MPTYIRSVIHPDYAVTFVFLNRETDRLVWMFANERDANKFAHNLPNEDHSLILWEVNGRTIREIVENLDGYQPGWDREAS